MSTLRVAHLNLSLTHQRKHLLAKLLICSLSFFGMAAHAAPPVVSTVPVAAEDPLQPHDLISGKATTLKGAVDTELLTRERIKGAARFRAA